jgi:hypothetical protein
MTIILNSLTGPRATHGRSLQPFAVLALAVVVAATPTALRAMPKGVPYTVCADPWLACNDDAGKCKEPRGCFAKCDQKLRICVATGKWPLTVNAQAFTGGRAVLGNMSVSQGVNQGVNGPNCTGPTCAKANTPVVGVVNGPRCTGCARTNIPVGGTMPSSSGLQTNVAAGGLTNGPSRLRPK